MDHDLSFHSGERQTASTYDEVRADHRYRYEWADRLIPSQGYGLDAFCGNGYGAWLLSKTRNLLAFDGSKEAVVFATEHFATPSARFAHAYWPFSLPHGVFDFVVSLESVEHVPDGAQFFTALVQSLKPGGMLVFSTPNEELLPHAPSGNHFHYKHYTLEETLALAVGEGLEIVAWAGQDTYLMQDGRMVGHLTDLDMTLKDQRPGQFNIVACRKPAQSRTVMARLRSALS